MIRFLSLLVAAAGMIATQASLAQPERMFLGDTAGAPGTLVTIPIDFRDDLPVRSFNGFVSLPTGLVTLEAFRCFDIPVANGPGNATVACTQGRPNIINFSADSGGLTLRLTPGRFAELDLRISSSAVEGDSVTGSLSYSISGNFGTRSDVDSGTVHVAEDRSAFFAGFCPSELPGPPDLFEPDDSAATATTMVARRASQASAEEPFVFDAHTFHDSDDEDWVVFQAYDDNRTYSLQFDLAGSEPGTGLPFDTSLGRGVGLLVQYFDQNGALLGLSGGGNIPEFDVNSYNPTFTGRCFDPIPSASFQGVRDFEGQVFARILQCRNAGLDLGGRIDDDLEYCIRPDAARYGVAVTANLDANPGVVKGRVLDAVSGEPIAFAAVVGTQITNFTSFSNIDGNFLQDDTSTNSTAEAVILKDGYNTVTIQFDINEGEVTDCGDILMTRETGSAPDLQVATPDVNPKVTIEGASVTATATISNVGDSGSSPTTLRFVASDDPVITAADPSFATVALPAIAPGVLADASTSAPAPVDRPMPLYMGACVDPAAGEQNSDNNCFGFAPLFLDSRLVFADGFEQQGQKVTLRKPAGPSVPVKGAVFCNVVP
ncbi:MAG: CARDB domain-containing protein [Xanthomonadales bacterium]|nr:CARDB domain-containing protein [Xanthomonadales bacterium]